MTNCVGDRALFKSLTLQVLVLCDEQWFLVLSTFTRHVLILGVDEMVFHVTYKLRIPLIHRVSV